MVRNGEEEEGLHQEETAGQALIPDILPGAAETTDRLRQAFIWIGLTVKIPKENDETCYV